MVALRLIVASFIVGVILAAFGFNPASLFSEVVRAARRLFELGFTDVHQLGRMLPHRRDGGCAGVARAAPAPGRAGRRRAVLFMPSRGSPGRFGRVRMGLDALLRR